MDYKKSNAPLNTTTRDLISMSEDTGNIYETVCIIDVYKRQSLRLGRRFIWL